MTHPEQKNENAIRVQNVSKTFSIPHEKVSTLKGAFVNLFKKNNSEIFDALKDISFEIKKGEFFGIIGRNGSGKSTLLKILAGIYNPNTGSVKVNGRISPFLELGIGFNPELSGRDNIYLNATVLGLTERQIDEKFDSIVVFSELERFIDQKLKNYSSGMSVRLAFSVAIHANRDILLMDEVLAVGDTNFQSKCLSEFNKYRDEGKTVVLVTHDIGTVQRYCDRALLLRNGKIEMIGDPEEVGTEYIYQNMSDEEKRIVKEQNQERIIAEKDAEKLEGKEKQEPARNASSIADAGGEEKRIEDEKIKQEPARNASSIADAGGEERKNKVAEITKVEFLDKDGKVKNVFETGEDISIRVYFKQNKIVPVLNFGVAVYNQENQYLFGINTIIDKINTKKYLEDGYFQVNYKNLPIKTNTCYIVTGIFGENDGKIYDFLGKSNSFKVFSKNQNQGLVEINYEWE